MDGSRLFLATFNLSVSLVIFSESQYDNTVSNHTSKLGPGVHVVSSGPFGGPLNLIKVLENILMIVLSVPVPVPRFRAADPGGVRGSSGIFQF